MRGCDATFTASRDMVPKIPTEGEYLSSVGVRLDDSVRQRSSRFVNSINYYMCNVKKSNPIT